MANTHIPKHGFSSPGRDGRKLPASFFNVGGLFQRVVKRLCEFRYSGLIHFRSGLLPKSFVVVFLISCEMGFAGEVQLRIAGDYKYTVVLPDNTRIAKQGKFSVVSAGCLWKIRTLPPTAEPQPNGVQYQEVGFDGEGIFEYTKFLEGFRSSGATYTGFDPAKLPEYKAPKLTQASGNTKIMNTGVGQIYLDCIPNAKPNDAIPFWVAFGSSCYFRTNLTGMARQVWEGPSEFDLPPTNLLAAEWKLTDTTPTFLEKLTYYLSSGVDSSQLAKTKKQTLAEFSVSNFTNVNGAKIPFKFKLTRFSELIQEDVAVAPTFLAEYECEVKAVEVINVTQFQANEFRPNLAENTYVRDARLLSDIAIPVVYLITNTAWPSIEKVTKYNAVKMQIRTKNEAKPLAKGKTLAWIFILFTASTVALGVILLGSNKHKQKTNKL